MMNGKAVQAGAQWRFSDLILLLLLPSNNLNRRYNMVDITSRPRRAREGRVLRSH